MRIPKTPEEGSIKAKNPIQKENLRLERVARQEGSQWKERKDRGRGLQPLK